MSEDTQDSGAPVAVPVPGERPVRRRPTVHFTATDGWINDPYGIVWAGDRYHLFYLALPGRVTWGPETQWGHAESCDLAHWREQPTALAPHRFEVGCWSGSVILADDDADPTLLCTRVSGDEWGRGQIAIAHGDHAAKVWRTSVADCVIDGPPPELEVHSFRDPYVWWNGRGWTMIVGAGLPDGYGAALQYRSTDLSTWTYDGILCRGRGNAEDQVWTGSLWECPQLFPLGKHWVLIISIWHDDTLHYVAAAAGDYDGHTFSPSRWQRLTYGKSAYAMTSFLDKSGRRCVMSWLREEPTNNPHLADRAGAHSIAALITLGSHQQLHLDPHPDVTALFAEEHPSATAGQPERSIAPNTPTGL